MRLLATVLLCFLLAATADAQILSTVHQFPLFVDGVAADGSVYRSTVLVTPGAGLPAPSCGLELYGLSARFAGTVQSSFFDFALAQNGALAEQSSGSQPLAIGYAIVRCNHPVHANVLYSYYAPDGAKLSESTAFGTSLESNQWRIIADQRQGSQLGIAVANGTSFTRVYDFAFTSGGITYFGAISVPPRDTATRFLSDIVAVPSGAVGLLTIASRDFSDFSAVGLRFTGPRFATIPAN